VRVRKAMERLTRNKWMCGEDVKRIGYRLSCCASDVPWSVMKAVIPGEAEIVGMIHGAPVAYAFETHYREVLKLLWKQKEKLDSSIELSILNILLKVKK
jgi:hypothetical protein